ncbi:Ppx/GppA family phosphatase [Mangrovibrevibacter kandeliae]|uniref:Ppx/GppA family phosphatase n=1 Tax=Mangrovibrevibacter kandeliae TaxID=2968473 RepID=UPI00389B1690
MLQSLSPSSAHSTRASIDPDAQGRFRERAPVAVVDIGSNSVRLVIYEGNSRALTQLFNEKVLSGLGKGLTQTNRLDDDAVASALTALRRFRKLADQAGVVDLYPLATAATREAANGPDFVAAAEAAIGRPIIILSGADEARYAAEGVVAGFHLADGIAGDLGGGSLELVDIDRTTIGEGLTLPLGGLRLQDLSGNDIARARDIADSHVAACALAGRGKGRPFFAVGGTWRNLAKLHIEQTKYPLHVMHGYEMTLDVLGPFLERVAKNDPDKMPGIASISKARRALLAFGAVTMQAVVKHVKPSSVFISALGVREGYLHSLLGEEDKAKDPLIEAAREFAILRARSPRHAEEMIAWSDHTFKTLGIAESEDHVRLRHAASLLADIGWRAHPDYRGQQSLSIVAHAAFSGISHPGRAYLGLANYYRHEGDFEQSAVPDIERLADKDLLRRAQVLAALFRVGYLLTASMPGVLDRLRWKKAGRGGFALTVPRDLAALTEGRPESRLQAFAKVVGLKLKVEVV